MLFVPNGVIPLGPIPGPGSLTQTVSFNHSPNSGIFWSAVPNATLHLRAGRSLINGGVAPGWRVNLKACHGLPPPVQTQQWFS